MFFEDVIGEENILQLLHLQSQEPSPMPRKHLTWPSFAAQSCEGLRVLFPNTVAQIVVFLIYLQPLALAPWRLWPCWWSLLLYGLKRSTRKVYRNEYCVTLCPPALHTLFHASQLQLHVNSLAMSYAFQLTTAGYKPWVIFHGQTFWSFSWCLTRRREEENILEVSSQGVSCCSLWSPYGL